MQCSAWGCILQFHLNIVSIALYLSVWLIALATCPTKTSGTQPPTRSRYKELKYSLTTTVNATSKNKYEGNLSVHILSVSFCQPNMINEKVQPKIKTLIFTHLNVMTNLNDVFTEHKRSCVSSSSNKSFVLKDRVGLSFPFSHNELSQKLLTFY